MEHLYPFIYGKLLGGACLEKPAKSTFNSRMKIKQKIDHEEYVKQCWLKLHNFSLKMYLDSSVRIHKGIQKRHFAWSFKTKALPIFTELRNKWYKDKKCLPDDLELYFTKELIAYWFMDDGYTQITGKYIRSCFCTDNFTEQEVDRLIMNLNKFNLNAVKANYKGNFHIEVRTLKNATVLFDLIREFVPECLQYKIRIPQ